MDLRDLDRFLGIDPDSSLDKRARLLVEADAGLLDDLIQVRVAKKLSQTDVANRMGISQSGVARIEAGDRDPRMSTLRRYALAVGAIVSHAVDDDETVKVTGPSAAGTHLVEAVWPAPARRVSSEQRVDA